ncbi:MAG: hypothetical protein K2W78_12895 [Xanthobacteraceae bacterium]|nr:hypothetical protein [Xanthobacteraceae bacterium]
MDDFQSMSREERELLDRVAEQWGSYGPALREKLAIQGNMTWKTAKGAQYLVRYYRDDAGVLVNKSLGRRSPETEAVFEEFRSRRDAARQTVAQGEDSMVLVGRLAKAHGLARMPARHAEVLRAFWREGLDDQMMLFCGASMYAYERTGRMRAPAHIAKDEVLTFVLDPRAEHVALDLIRDTYKEAIEATAARIDQVDGRIRLYSSEKPALELVSESWLVHRVEDRHGADVLSSALRDPPHRAVVVARDSRPVEIRTLDPRAYTLACSVMSDEIWNERARFMADVVRRTWGFEPDQEELLSAFDPDGHGSPPRM